MPPILLDKQISSDKLPFKLPHIDGSANTVKEARKLITRWWDETHTKKNDALVNSFIYAAFIDHIIKMLFSNTKKISLQGHSELQSNISIMALGGYGRCEMSPHSDIDLLFLHEGKNESYVSEVNSAVLYPLWDSGFEAGGATRTISDCEEILQSDTKAFSAMLDARYVAGNKELADKFQKHVTDCFKEKSVRKKFVDQKIKEYRERKIKFGDSIYLLQPNIKEGEGGLRDFHTLIWLTRSTYSDGPLNTMLKKAGLTDKGLSDLEESVRFLWRIRHSLHLKEGKRHDRLGEEQQDVIARTLGFEDTSISSASEKLMQSYYRCASIIHRNSQWAIEKMSYEWRPSIKKFFHMLTSRSIEQGVTVTLGKKLSISNEAIVRDPLLMLRSFVYIKKKRLYFDAATKVKLEAHAHLIAEEHRNSPEAKGLWHELLKDVNHLDRTFFEMHECGCLKPWIPELNPIIHSIKHDGFHIYTVDVHTLHAIAELSKLVTREYRRVYPIASNALHSVKRPHILVLATLLHDIGKGYGSNHEETGAEISRSIALRMGFSSEDAEEVSFLVRSHMLMPKLAFRRDTSEETLIERFAQTVRTPQMLSMLYLLTYADLKSVGPHTWSSWKEGLLNDLYTKTKQCLIQGQNTEVWHERMFSKRTGDTKKLLGKNISQEFIDDFISRMPKRYILKQSAPAIATHLELIKALSDKKKVVCDLRNDHERGFSEISLVTKDCAGLFARIAGILSSNSLNIVEADLYTTQDGIAVDIIRVTDLKHKPIEDVVRWKRLLQKLSSITEDENIYEKIDKRLKKHFKVQRRKQEPRVEIDNDVSATDTVLEIHADDRPGLLYRISRIIAGQGFTIERARIATHVGRVTDVFYIRDRKGSKVSTPESLSVLQNVLRDELQNNWG